MAHSCHQPLVSIVIPTYNHGHLIGRALNSVVNQTFSHWEAIVVDNYSRDDTYQVVSRFYDPRIRYYKFHNNGIIAASRNFGIKVSNGSCIAFLDSDDWWSFNKLEKCVLLATSNIDIVYHDLYLARHHCQKLFVRRVRSRVLSTNAFSDIFNYGSPFPNSSAFIRKSSLAAIGYISESQSKVAMEDYDTWLRLARSNFAFKKLTGAYGYYWIGGGNTSNALRTISNVLSFRQEYFTSDSSPFVQYPFWTYFLAVCATQLGHLGRHSSISGMHGLLISIL